MDFISNSWESINWWAVIVAVLSSMPVGYLWYDLKVGFGRPWAKMNGLKEKDLQNPENFGKTMGVMLLFAVATAITLACLQLALGISGFVDSVVFGIIVGLVFRGGAHFIHNGYTKRPDSLTLIDAGHDVVSIVVMSVILGMWT